MSHYNTFDTVSKLLDLRKAPQEATQTSGNSVFQINYVSMELHQMSVEIRQKSQEMTPRDVLTTLKVGLLNQDKARVELVYRTWQVSAGRLRSFIIFHQPQHLMGTSNIAFASQVDLN